MRYTVTIPAAGEKTIVPLSGRSVIVEEMGVYPAANDVPTMNFISGISDYPLYPRSVYPNSQRFDHVEIIGTSESAGDSVKLLSTDQCLDLDINLLFSSSYEAVAGTSFPVTTTDAAQTLSELQLINAAGQLPKSIIVTAQNNPVIYAFNTAPDRTTDLGHILIPAVYTGGSEREVQLLEIEGIDFILNWNFAAAISGSQAEITITPRY